MSRTKLQLQSLIGSRELEVQAASCFLERGLWAMFTGPAEYISIARYLPQTYFEYTKVVAEIHLSW